MLRNSAILFGLLVAVSSADRPANAAGKKEHGERPAETLAVGGVVRTYRLVVPKSVDLARPAPLVVAFHGMLIDSKDLMPWYTKLNETAEKHRWILAYPEAIGRRWGISQQKVADDLAFFDALVARLGRDFRIDPDRTYVLGMSNGGYFAHLVAKERSRSVAAAAVHSGALGLQTLLGVNADRKFPVLIVHGDQDPIFSTTVSRENRDKYLREGHVVKYVEVPGLGHSWATKVDVNETIAKFFAEHRLRMR